MSAATAAIAISRRQGTTRQFPVKGSSKVFEGTFACLTTGGYLRAGAAANVTDKVVGLAAADVDNSTGADGDLSLDVEFGIFEVKYTGTAPTRADVAKRAPLYLSDDNTVTLDASNTPPVAGALFALSATSGMCWIAVGPVIPMAPAITLGNTDGEIGGLTIGGTYSQSEVQALRAKCEELADDVRALVLALQNAGIIG